MTSSADFHLPNINSRPESLDGGQVVSKKSGGLSLQSTDSLPKIKSSGQLLQNNNISGTVNKNSE